jgi:hypothetical protein
MNFAREAARQKHLTRGNISDPYVVGAIIDLGHCFNLLEAEALSELKDAHSYLEIVHEVLGKPLPQNTGRELGARFLDKAVIESVHGLRKRRRLPKYDSVRSSFVEGEKLYEGAGWRSKNHIQVAVRDVACIRGYFRLPGL